MPKVLNFSPAEKATTPPIPLVRAAFSVPVLKVLQEIGVAEAEFRRVGIPIVAEPTPITLMPEKPWWELLGNVSRREDIADLGLLAGQCLPFSEIQSVAPQLGGCSTLHELLVRLHEVQSRIPAADGPNARGFRESRGGSNVVCFSGAA